MSRLFIGPLIVLLCSFLCLAHDNSLIPVADGFTWAENLIFSADALFVTDVYRGELWKITRTESGAYNKTLHLDGFSGFLGLAISEDYSVLYAVSKTKSGTCLILAVDPVHPANYSVVAKLPKLGNGLALDIRTNLLYSASEGSFIPLNGEVFCINPVTGEVSSLASRLTAADGCWIDQTQQLLYVSNVLSSVVYVFDLRNSSMVHSFKAPGVSLLDDYTLSADGSTLYGAEFGRGNVVMFATNGDSSSTVVASGMKNPTSARWGNGGGFAPSSLFITEGGGLTSLVKNRHVWELPNAR